MEPKSTGAGKKDFTNTWSANIDKNTILLPDAFRPPQKKKKKRKVLRTPKAFAGNSVKSFIFNRIITCNFCGHHNLFMKQHLSFLATLLSFCRTHKEQLPPSRLFGYNWHQPHVQHFPYLKQIEESFGASVLDDQILSLVLDRSWAIPEFGTDPSDFKQGHISSHKTEKEGVPESKFGLH